MALMRNSTSDKSFTMLSLDECTSTETSCKITWRLVIEHPRNKYLLLTIKLDQHDTGEAVMLALQQVYYETAHWTYLRRFCKELLCQAQVLKVAVLSTVSAALPVID